MIACVYRYSSLHPPNYVSDMQGFHRVTTREGGSANLNAVGSTSQSFLWTHEGASRGHPIVEV